MKSLLLIALIAISVATPMAFADISVKQDNLTEQEQKVLADIAAAKADGTYITPPEAELTANIQLYSEDVVIQSPFPVSEVYCGDTIYKFGIPEMECHVIGTIPQGMALWDEVDNKWIPTTVVTEEAKKLEIEAQAMALTDDEKKLQGVENLINKLKLKSNPTATDLQIIEHFDSFSLCMRGLEDTEAFQTRNTFVVPVDALELVEGQWVLVIPELDDGNFDFGRNSGIAGDLYIAGEECKAQIKLMGYTTPDHYRNMVMNEDDFQPTHQDMAKLDKGIEAFGNTDFADRKDGDAITEAAKSNYVICISDRYSDKFKTQMGCPSPYIGFNTPHEPSGFTLETTTPMIKHEKHGIVCGLLPDNTHIVNDRYWNYLKSLQTYPSNCDNWDRIVAIMMFDPHNWDEALIEQVVQDWESKQQ